MSNAKQDVNDGAERVRWRNFIGESNIVPVLSQSALDQVCLFSRHRNRSTTILEGEVVGKTDAHWALFFCHRRYRVVESKAREKINAISLSNNNPSIVYLSHRCFQNK